jgi:hypothetical protein
MRATALCLDPRFSGYEIARRTSPHSCSPLSERLSCSQVGPDLLNMEPRMAPHARGTGRHLRSLRRERRLQPAERPAPTPPRASWLGSTHPAATQTQGETHADRVVQCREHVRAREGAQPPDLGGRPSYARALHREPREEAWGADPASSGPAHLLQSLDAHGPSRRRRRCRAQTRGRHPSPAGGRCRRSSR